MITYFLVDNKMTPDPDDRRAQTLTRGSKDDNALIDHMIARGSTVTRGEALATIHEFSDAIGYFLQEGYSINSRLLKAGPSISGVFASDEDSFDNSRHQLKIKMLPGEHLKEVPQRIKLTKVEGNPALPLPKYLLDVTTNTKNERLTPGGTVKLTGKRMKIDPTVPTQGVFLLSAGKATKVDTFVINRPSELVMILPKVLAKGSYQLEVRGTVNGADRNGQLPVMLTV